MVTDEPERTREIRLFAVDLDGTLLNDEVQVSAVDRTALLSLSRGGVEVCVLSGRMPLSIYRVSSTLPFVRYVSGYHGAVVEESSSRTVLSMNAVPVETAKAIESWAGGDGNRIIVFSGDRAFAAVDDDVVRNYSRRTGVVVEPSTEFTFDLPVAKIVVYFPPEGRLGQLGRREQEALMLERTAAVVEPSCRRFPSGLGFVEITSKTATKGIALAQLAALMGLSLSEVAAIGDGHNDIDMLEASALRFAVGNAAQALKDIATDVVGSNNASGVAEAAHIIAAHNEGIRAHHGTLPHDGAPTTRGTT